ncbi:MAG: 2-oxoacid:acceptor oxidoreductase family protein [Nitrososphaerota archaeon]|jgi:pyruvate ferredoxin oxidoreductase gamma subunit|nr:2-oxoacid:acceptor oxidoreductase family protein [Nitrososphaerota archaeon]
MMIRVRFHGRGGQGAKTASRILGTAAFNEGLNVQDSPVYGAERRGAPVAAFTRISDGEVLERGYVFDPDVVMVMDSTLLDNPTARPLDGIRRRGVLFVNSQTGSSFHGIQTARPDIRVATFDLTGEALSLVGKAVISSATAAAAARIIGLVTDGSLEKAIRSELEELGLNDELIEKNVTLGRKVFASLEPVELSTDEYFVRSGLVPFELIMGERTGTEEITSAGNSNAVKTGSWRIFKPIIDYNKCTACMVCFAYCPESALTLRGDYKPVIDEDNCKGCLICYRECPPKAITLEKEVREF